MISATHRRFGASASKRRSTRSGAGPRLHLPARRAGAAAPAHPGDASLAHHPRDPLAADRDTGFGQFGVNPRRAVRAPAPGMNLLHAGRQLRIGLRTS